MRHLDGPAVSADPRPWVEAYEEVYAALRDLPDHRDPPIGERLVRAARRDGFALTAAYVGHELGGFVYGYSLPAGTGWWEGLAPAPDPAFVREWPGRTVALCEGLVRPPFRRDGLARRGVEEFLADRTEERASALVEPDNTAMLRLCDDLGWRRVGTLVPYPGWRRHLALVLPLRGVKAR